MAFPAHFPDQCPPKTSSEAKGDLFRFVNNDPPQATDFVSYHLLGIKYRKSQHCEACGLSVLVSETDVKRALESNALCSEEIQIRGERHGHTRMGENCSDWQIIALHVVGSRGQKLQN